MCAKDARGNYTPRMGAEGGQAYEMVKDHSGDVLRPSSTPATNSFAVEVRNDISMGSVDACIYR